MEVISIIANRSLLSTVLEFNFVDGEAVEDVGGFGVFGDGKTFQVVELVRPKLLY